MKSDRKWILAAQTGLVLNIVLSILFVGFVMWKIVPKLQQLHQRAGSELWGFTQATIHVCEFIVNYWYLCPIALAAAVGFFEWMCKSENKRSIRTFILVGLSLLSVAGALWTALVIAVSFALLPPN